MAREIEKTVATLLEPIGFRKRTGPVYTVDLAPDVFGWVALNAASFPPRVYEVNPLVGVRLQQLEQLTDELGGPKSSPLQATLWTNLFHLTGRPGFQYEFLFGAPVLSTAKALVEDVRAYGVPYMVRNASLQAAITTFSRHVDGHGVFNLPVAHALTGDFDSAERAIAAQLTRFPDLTHPFARRYAAFAQLLRARIASGSLLAQ